MQAKQSILSVALLLATVQLFSQQDSSGYTGKSSQAKPNFELGTQIVATTARAGNFQSNYSTVWDNQFFSGLYLKRYFGNNAFRASVNYSKRRVFFDNAPQFGNFNLQGQLSSLDFKFGYQHLLGGKKFSPYWFTDVEYAYFFATHWPNNTILPFTSYLVPYYPYYKFYSLNGSQIALNPGIGLRWQLAANLCLNIESAAQLFYFHERKVGVDRPLNAIGINAKPLTISLGVKF